MNLAELSALLGTATDVLRVETLDRYVSVNDDGNFARYLAGEPGPDRTKKQGWLDRLTTAAERGRPWRRLRVVSRPASDYVQYACEWGYVDNVAAGEIIRVLDEAEDYTDELSALGDFWVADDRVVAMAYDQHGGFLDAHEETSGAEVYLSKVDYGWKHAADFTEWWAANPDLHRDLAHA